MNTLTVALFQRKTLNGIFIDILAFAFICLVPTISHLLSLPVYLIEPMRLMLILALVHSSKMNGYFLALTMPLLSLLISGHPVIPKMMLIIIELTLNVFLFFILVKRIKHLFPAVFLSIVISKTVYYILKYLMIQLTIMNSGLITTPIFIQIGTSLLFSFYMVAFYKKQDIDN
jgi:hypothetical protein